MFVSLTRLRLRSLRFLPPFLADAIRSRGQAQRADGYAGGALLADRKLTFWTMTAWRDEDAMRRYMTTGAHCVAMPKLMRWCDEASVAHWEQPDAALPDWTAAAHRMRREGRPSRVRHPGPRHADLSFDAPRTSLAVSLAPERR